RLRADLPPPRLPADVVAGRRLFSSAMETKVAASGAGVSCDTCHADGRNDGLTWVFDDLPRQTPSLAGQVTDTLPLTWLGDVASVEEEVHATTTSRMGGSGVSDAEAKQIAAYVAWTRDPIHAAVDEAGEAAIERGRAIFESKAVGCTKCHTGPAFTDGESWKVLRFDMETNTPTLRGIAATAPYLHDGSAATLR